MNESIEFILTHWTIATRHTDDDKARELRSAMSPGWMMVCPVQSLKEKFSFEVAKVKPVSDDDILLN